MIIQVDECEYCCCLLLKKAIDDHGEEDEEDCNRHSIEERERIR